MPKVLTERATSAARLIREAAAGPRYRVRLIEGPRWGSSGYYTAEALDSGPAAFDGAKVYLDHPTRSDETERPERSLRDRVGSLANVTREADGVWGELSVHPHMAKLVESLASEGDLDMSIRATAEAKPGEVNGRSGLIVTRFIEGRSVDLVTEAGAGGRVFELLESARAGAVEALSSDLSDQLRRAVEDAYTRRDRDQFAWVRDFDDEARLVFFEFDGKTWQQTWERVDIATVALTGERLEVCPITQFHPVTSAGPVGESAPAHTTKEKHMEITEAKFAELTAAANRVTALEAERDSAIQRAEAAEADARTAAREAYATQVTAALAASDLPVPARDRVAATLALGEADQPPAAPSAAIESAISAERAYVASLAPVLGKVEQSRKLGFGAAESATVSESYTNPWGRTINTVKEA